MSKKRMYLNAFEMSTAGFQSHALWRHPDDNTPGYKDIEYWTHLAKILEKGRFDGVFLADVLGVYDVYKDSRDPAIINGMQVPVNDPAFVIPVMASVTKHLGFGLTASTTYDHPYTFARKMSTLDHLTKGRIGWNIVTSYLNSAAKNIGLDQQTSHDERYEKADEYMEVVYKLWEASWEDDAVVVDKEKGIYTDPSKVHDINHDGKYYQVPGNHICEPSPQRTPVIFQAGASSRGRKFAADHAELVFVSSPSLEKTKDIVLKFRKDIVDSGRSADDVKVITTVTPIVAPTTEEAVAKLEDYKQYISHEAALALVGGWTGINLDELDPNQKVEYIENDAMRSILQGFAGMTVHEIAEKVALGGLGELIVGDPEQIADTLEEWMDYADIDGFNIVYSITPGSFEDFVELVVPVLQERGLVRREYEDGTFRNNLFGRDQLADEHPAKQVRKGVIPEAVLV
ncbi:LLM class flavin-dependent oxidoreductase [Sporosarcina sp. Marseille-Q4063]|uniref:LLM class flavin-dependent oxidoreductase n=1 Tax=Sporosarcina sp. Marseille-Q4063 TaxID=2810514 RepID=UPI001BAE8D7F|nr:LLM class flavin-dependent oxidoreductase [Sporosarcina sp. Marseille-Q4063]QUW22866.1 LLM class flavin-dependent oxidoreductase [Sporosarcina sp. Marseille-Q4063]